MVGAIGGGAVGGGMGMCGPGMAAGVAGPGSAAAVAGAASGGTANRVGTTPADPTSGTKVSISAAARKALAMDNSQAKSAASSAGKTASAPTSTGSPQAAAANANTGTPASTLSVHLDASLNNVDLNAQFQNLSDAKFWDDMIAALILALLLQDRQGHGA